MTCIPIFRPCRIFKHQRQNIANEEKSTILCGKLFQCFTTRSLKKFFRRVRAAVVYRQLEGVTTGYGAVAIGRHQLEIISHANIY